MRTFGLVVPAGGGRIFEANVRALLEGQAALAGSILPRLEAWRALKRRCSTGSSWRWRARARHVGC
jgi:transposase